MNTLKLVLASSSSPRKKILNHLGIPFISISPNINEKPFPMEKISNLVQRLSKEKVIAVSSMIPKNKPFIILGCDQMAIIDKEIIGKPYSYNQAFIQLKKIRGKCVKFYCGICVFINTENYMKTSIEKTEVFFRKFSIKEIELYLKQEKPYKCAGSFKSEGRGILLVNKILGKDPNSLIGLPVLLLQKILLKKKINLLNFFL